MRRSPSTALALVIPPLIALGTLVGGPAVAAADEAPDSSGPIVLRGAYQGLAWWIVDPGTGMAAFYGGDIQTICENDPNMFGAVEGFSDVRYQVVEGPNDRWTDLERGDDVGASLWDGPPPFRLPQLCANILSRSPVAVGTARVKLNVVNLGSDPAAHGRSVITFTGKGSFEKPDGESVSVQSSSTCSWPAGESIDVVYDCRSRVDVR